MTQIKKGDRITVSHPKDGKERSGLVESILLMAERDEIHVRIDGVGTVILHVHPGTKKRDRDEGSAFHGQEQQAPLEGNRGGG